MRLESSWDLSYLAFLWILPPVLVRCCQTLWQVACISDNGWHGVWAQEEVNDKEAMGRHRQQHTGLQVTLTHRTRRSGYPSTLPRCSQSQDNGRWWSPWYLLTLVLEWDWVTAQKGSLKRSRETPLLRSKARDNVRIRNDFHAEKRGAFPAVCSSKHHCFLLRVCPGKAKAHALELIRSSGSLVLITLKGKLTRHWLIYQLVCKLRTIWKCSSI